MISQIGKNHIIIPTLSVYHDTKWNQRINPSQMTPLSIPIQYTNNITIPPEQPLIRDTPSEPDQSTRRFVHSNRSANHTKHIDSSPSVPSQEPIPYQYTYNVKDEYAGADFGHNEGSDGHNAQGSFYVQLPDGRRQTVRRNILGI